MEFSETALSVQQCEDRKAFDELVHRYHRHAYNVAYRMTGNHNDAEDLTQETFLKAYRFFDRYRRDMPFENWLYRIMSNTFLDWLRRRPKISVRSLDETIEHEDSESTLELPNSSEGPEALLIARELDDRLQRALTTLPHDFRITVILADIEGLSYEEISDTLGCSIGTVRSRLHRARKLLREKLKPYFESIKNCDSV